MPLVLTRKVGETILIGDDIEVKVNEVGGGKARLLVVAPDEVPIVRKEISRRVGGRIVHPNRNPDY